MRILYKQDILDIAYGATFLGAGGGGPVSLSLRMLDELEKKQPIRLEMIEVDEMEEGKYACMVAGFGSPSALDRLGFGRDAIYAFLGYRDEYRQQGLDLAYTYSGEYGGLSTFVPMYVAMSCGVPFVNLDGNGRAVPEVGTTLLPLFGYPTTPVVMANENGDVTIGKPRNPNDVAAGEKIARQMCMAYGMKVGFACWAVDKHTATKYMIPSAMNKAEAIGKFLRAARGRGADASEAICKAIEARELFRGAVADIELTARDGFDFGTVRISTGGGEACVMFKNENMYAKDQAGTVVLTVPESICLLNTETAEPLNNASVKEGMNVAVVAIPAAAKWWEVPDGYNCWKHILKSMGYEGQAVRY